MKSLKLALFAASALASTSLFAMYENPYEKSAYDYFQQTLASTESEGWSSVLTNSQKIINYYPACPFIGEAFYYQGQAFYKKGEYSLANRAFSSYLRRETTPRYFEEAIQYKYDIARAFHQGRKTHLFGARGLPRWVPAKDEALELYDEVIATLPRHELTAESLYYKGCLLFSFDDYKASVESFQTLIRRFPKHHRAAQAFIEIGNVYFVQCKREFPDPDLLDLAEINLQRFKESFPSEPRIIDAEKSLAEMRNTFAKELFEIGEFYYRTKKYKAARIYFTSLLTRYPSCKYAKKSQKHLTSIEKKLS